MELRLTHLKPFLIGSLPGYQLRRRADLYIVMKSHFRFRFIDFYFRFIFTLQPRIDLQVHFDIVYLGP